MESKVPDAAGKRVHHLRRRVMRTSSIVRWSSAVAAMLVLAATGPAWSQEATSPAATPPATVDFASQRVVTPAAQAVLDRMTAALKGHKRYAISADITRDEVLLYGYKMQHNETARMWVEAPNHLRLELKGDIKNRTYIYDGAQLVVHAPDANVYASGAAPGTLGELASALLEQGVEMPLIDMLFHGHTGNLAEEVRIGLVVGDSMVGGVATDHLAFRQANVDWQLWVEKGARALPRKLLITTRYAVGDPQYQAVLTWDLDPKPPAGAFTFQPPAGATKIPMMTRLVTSGGGQ
jgi:hypothetical protein